MVLSILQEFKVFSEGSLIGPGGGGGARRGPARAG